MCFFFLNLPFLPRSISLFAFFHSVFLRYFFLPLPITNKSHLPHRPLPAPPLPPTLSRPNIFATRCVFSLFSLVCLTQTSLFLYRITSLAVPCRCHWNPINQSRRPHDPTSRILLKTKRGKTAWSVG